ncbi:glycosyltransferase family A protein [uncultured Alistipes sp.]|jgi:glycosyltransferases involved in cell wall biogenesis|uniref:glycosyltransferase family 2 protein n=1 Tax=uncultured Alistipes sp. TaxID=538949 RepID=UPI0025D9B0F6|nr:glycosyltransferase family A protein [uncultured Alistipes sp.]
MASPTISVIIPLYNKEREIGGTVRSVLAQTLPPTEIVIVDDGSTDGSAGIVRSITSPLIKLVQQANGGECAARNRAIAESTGDYIALLDADDEWEPGFLEEIASMIAEFPGCGVYCTAFNIVSHDGTFPARTPSERGVIDNFFRDSAHQYIAIPSASTIPRAVFETVGGFPEGIKIGGDMYMWIKIARRFRVCFSPRPLVNYSKVASNRSATSYTPERTRYSFEELYDPAAPTEQNEFLARAALGRALIISARGGTQDAARAAKFFAYTKTYRRTLRKVRFLNALPASWRGPLIGLYNSLAWKISRKGL